LVNAAAHRQYEDAGRKIMLEIFADRITVSSPGLPPAPLTINQLRRGKYRPCSRNPLLAQCLSYFHRIEERGSGFRRMRDQMLRHGLDQPVLATDSGYFQVTFVGPGDDLERIPVPIAPGPISHPFEARLTEREKDMVRRLAGGEELTSRQCQQDYRVSAQTLHKDFQTLLALGLARRIGSGRSARYAFVPQE
jgi:predicted HTH transcriptional regulator